MLLSQPTHTHAHVRAVQADFPGLNPANPVHFYAISKRCYTALGRNNLKVTEKDL
jgi:hypothetical protein